MPDNHYFAERVGTPSAPRTVRLDLPDVSLTLHTDRGVFGREGVDPGTRLLLLEAPRPPATGEIVDLGAGYGPIACTLAARAPGARVWAVEVNERARDLTARNAREANLQNVVVGEPPVGMEIDALYSNPPIRIGKAALHELLGSWLARLRPGARAWLVVHRHLGADSLAAWLRASGYPTERLVSRQGYRLLEVTRP